MKKRITLDIHIDKNKKIILIPYQKTKIGFSIACEPWVEYSSDEWENIPKHIFCLIELMKGWEETDDTDGSIFKVYNYPRLSDGSYGIEKGGLSEKYSTRYTSSHDVAAFKKIFLMAYRDSQKYLEAISANL